MNTLRFGAILATVAAISFAVGCTVSDKDETGAAGASSMSDAGAGAGGAPSEQPGDAMLEIIGTYDDNFNGVQTITATAWNDSAIVGFDNETNVVYTQFPDDAEFNASKFAKTVYTDLKDGSFYFCMVEFSADTLEDAKASTMTADDSDPENGGCGGDFPWTKATAK
jgi:hypothetical protein